MQIKYHDHFDCISGDIKSEVFEIFPNVFSDKRGSFTEVWKNDEQLNSINIPTWFLNTSWIKQINRSSSLGKVIRGCHAQKNQWCQAKLVQALTQQIYDVIIDARPNSNTFGTSEVILLDPLKQNQLFVPRGFLHAFATVANDNCESIFEYYCDNIYCKDSEIGVNPMTITPNIAENCQALIKENGDKFSYLEKFVSLFSSKQTFSLSEKDLKAPSYDQWMHEVKEDYRINRKLWYNP